MIEYSEFVSGSKTLVVAPAGYGKTHLIAECLKYTSGKQLILTHTHAGVASIKEKIISAGIPSSNYCVETISSFSQRYLTAYYVGSDLPDQEDRNDYNNFVIQKSKEIFTSKIVSKVLQQTYSGLFVDEYQDCTRDQHQMIISLALALPTHILGDPMQGIFDFNGESVDFENDLSEFIRFPDLQIPHRWYKETNNRYLGDLIKDFRSKLESKLPIELVANNDNGFHVIQINENDINNKDSTLRILLSKLINNPDNNPDFESLLLIVPEYEIVKNGDTIPKGGILDRAKLRNKIDYKKSLKLIEAIDDKSFYSIAKNIDDIILNLKSARKPTKKIKEEILLKLFNKTEINKWFGQNDLKQKRDVRDRITSEKINTRIKEFIEHPSAQNLHSLIFDAKKELKLKYKRDELLHGILRSLKQAGLDGKSVHETMKLNRDKIRRVGRKIHGKCLGTTLLTKGLEFDTVAILDADKFETPEHLYVALSRCCKRLVIFTSYTTLNPYK